MEYGLIGEKLGHSYSKLVQEKLLSHYTYELHPLLANKVDTFLKEKAFKAINVTIPYKQTVIPYLDVMDHASKQIGAVNTIVNKDGKLYGYNTDYHGFAYMLEKHHVIVKNKKILVLGNGGGSKAIKAVLKDQGTKTILFSSRTIKDCVLPMEEIYAKHSDIEIIVNTTPLGMYPNVEGQMVDFNMFSHLEACVDIVYNPFYTSFLLEAKKRNIKAVSGLEMLVAQAKYALEYFKDITIDNEKIDIVYKEIVKEALNIAVCDMSTEEVDKLASLTNKKVCLCDKKEHIRDLAIQSNLLIVLQKEDIDDSVRYELERNSILLEDSALLANDAYEIFIEKVNHL